MANESELGPKLGDRIAFFFQGRPDQPKEGIITFVEAGAEPTPDEELLTFVPDPRPDRKRQMKIIYPRKDFREWIKAAQEYKAAHSRKVHVSRLSGVRESIPESEIVAASAKTLVASFDEGTYSLLISARRLPDGTVQLVDEIEVIEVSPQTFP